MKLLLIFLFFHLSSSVDHSLKFLFTGFSGIQDFPDLAGTIEVDRIQAVYCDSNKKMETKQDWVENVMQTDKEHRNWYKDECFTNQPYFFEILISKLKQALKQTGVDHILQMIIGCEWDDETRGVNSFMDFGFDGEDIISLDVKSLTWTTQKPQCLLTQLKWDPDESLLNFYKHGFSKVCLKWLQKYVDVGRNSQLRTVLPSVSLLQKSPSSPVSCHATGFFPDRAVMFWRRDGEELSKDVDHGEILPNHDGSFQMSMVLMKPPSDDWGRYECVFQLSGVEEDQVYKLHKDPIRTNHVNPIKTFVLIVAVMANLILILLSAVVVLVFKKRGKDTKTRTDLTAAKTRTDLTDTKTRTECPETLNHEAIPMITARPPQPGRRDFKHRTL